ncbi:phospholipase D-like domain-containing protein [Paenibacillus sp. FSL H7-0942]|uniref:phospholipase D-like domain-containing protein n=1 Tax=Paenibacillus sp. FSL H7-0942 TaxID=2921444 RepID=UPI00324D46E5
MDRLIHSNIKQRLNMELLNTHSEILIISAFVKLDVVKYIDSVLSNNYIKKSILVRFKLADLILGVTDIELYSYCKENGWNLYVNNELHSKIYVFDQKRIMIGSANATVRGIGLGEKYNIESMALIDINKDEMDNIIDLFRISMELSEELYNLMMIDYKNSNISDKEIDYNWSFNIKAFYKNNYLWIKDMFFSHSPTELCQRDVDILKLNFDYNLINIRNQFLQSKPYIWLKYTVLDETFFGELSQNLHNSLLDNPKPTRRELKILLDHLLNWVIELEIEEFEVSKPGYSQKIRRVY